MTSANNGPMAGTRVVDLTRILAGPFCAMMLGDMGADIIKVEPPGTGDDTRGWGPPYLKDADGKDTPEAAYFASVNRNKKSVTLDLKQAEGREIFLQLAKKSDVIVENFRRGVLERDCQRMINQQRNVFAAAMVAHGYADAMVTGLSRNFNVCYDDIKKAIVTLAEGQSIDVTTGL